MNIYMFSARSGDCFLLEVNHKIILVDGGYQDTFYNEIKGFLIKQKINRIDLLVATHIDNDHIQGLIELIKYNGPASMPKLVNVDEVWYNAYSHLPKAVSPRDLSEEERSILRAYVPPPYKSTQITNTFISGVQGMSLSHILATGGYPWNTTTDGAAICTENITSFDFDSKIKIRVLSPSQKQLEQLYLTWTAELKQKMWSFQLTDDPLFNLAMEAFMLSNSDVTDIWDEEISYSEQISILELALQTAHPDGSKTNASSISFLLECDGRRLLFLADAAEEHIIEILSKESNKFYDVIKLAHHGSLKNAIHLFDIIDGEIFFISTDGTKHNHPDLSTIAKIISKPFTKPRRLIFNYPNKAYQYYNNKADMDQYGYSISLSSNSVPITLD